LRAYILRRLLLTIPTVFFVTLIVFLLIRSIPGSIVDIMVNEQESIGAQVTKLDKQAIEHSLGLDVPIYTQYGRWISDIIVHGSLGTSLWDSIPVTEEIGARWPVTFELGILALIVTQVIALPIGVYSALRQNTWGDYLARTFAIFCIAVPSFWLATLVIVFPAYGGIIPRRYY
jgi:peptide/nickel transport system permease protein